MISCLQKTNGSVKTKILILNVVVSWRDRGSLIVLWQLQWGDQDFPQPNPLKARILYYYVVSLLKIKCPCWKWSALRNGKGLACARLMHCAFVVCRETCVTTQLTSGSAEHTFSFGFAGGGSGRIFAMSQMGCIHAVAGLFTMQWDSRTPFWFNCTHINMQRAKLPSLLTGNVLPLPPTTFRWESHSSANRKCNHYWSQLRVDIRFMTVYTARPLCTAMSMYIVQPSLSAVSNMSDWVTHCAVLGAVCDNLFECETKI